MLSFQSSGFAKSGGVRFAQQMIFFWVVLFFASLFTSSCSSTQTSQSRAISSHSNSFNSGVEGNSREDAESTRKINEEQANRTLNRFLMNGR